MQSRFAQVHSLQRTGKEVAGSRRTHAVDTGLEHRIFEQVQLQCLPARPRCCELFKVNLNRTAAQSARPSAS